jgi:serine/threonine-protein kinase
MGMGDLASDPQQIGRYRIRGELGRGGMGIVYRGEDPLIGREVAIKTLTEVTPELRERFYLEARSGILSHPNIVTVYELGEQDGNPFIAMELVAGESLEKMLRLRKRLLLLEALSIVEQLCAGLGHAHGHGVVHRDVKPANVLVRPDGRVTIVDFGIARLTDQTRQLTKTDTLLGTFHYIAPERMKGEASDGRADVWSVGVMLYEMLTGELPFKGKDVSSVYRMIHEPYVPLTEYVQDLPAGLSRVLDKALAKQVSDRYATAEEMAFDLQVIAETLKQERVSTLLQSARKLAEDREYANARAVLLQAQRIDPGNTDAMALVKEVQERLNELQRGEQLRQLVEQAQSALEDRRWDDAILFLQQAQKLDIDNSFGLNERLQDARDQKLQQQKVVSLWEQASDARRRGDLTAAQELLSEALRLDARSTDLRNAYSVVVREIRRRQDAAKVQDLLRSARESCSLRRYTEAISGLREATEIDPAHPEVQELLFSATTRQKEERRQHLLDKLVAEIQESMDREDFALAEDRITRALEALPGEGILPQLKTEIDARKREFERKETVRTVMLQSQNLLADDPMKALEAIEAGLAKADEDETLLQARARLQKHLHEQEAATARAQELARADAAANGKKLAEATETVAEAIPIDVTIAYVTQPLPVAQMEAKEEEQPGTREEIEQISASHAKPQQQEQASSPAAILAPSAVNVHHGEAKRMTGDRRSLRRYIYAGGAMVAAAIALAAGLTHTKYKEATAPSAVTQRAISARPPVQSPEAAPGLDFEIGASPWAKVLEVRDGSGKSVELPAVEQTTPLRLDGFKAGQYTVVLSGPNDEQKSVQCMLSQENHLCNAEIGLLDIQELLKGEQP